MYSIISPYLPWIILLIMLLILNNDYKKIKTELLLNPFIEYEYSQNAISYGVFGTFMGITIGLLNFDTNNLQSSVPLLLSGMQTAFLTSLLGMSASLYFKRLQSNARKASETEQDYIPIEDVNLNDILIFLEKKEHRLENNMNILTEIIKDKQTCDKNFHSELLNSIDNRIENSLSKITTSLVGDGESTLIGQLKLMRTESRDSNYELIREFRIFAQQMAENNSKAFIQALNDSMKDLNNQLQEQFGENFKQLNLAVGKLLEWQENYKNIIIETTENQKEIFQKLDLAKTALEEMASNSNAITTSANSLADIVVTLSAYQETILSTLSRLGDISKNAEKLLPNIDILIQEAHSGILKSSDLANKEVAQTTKASMSELSTLSSEFKLFSENTLSHLNTLFKQQLSNIEALSIDTTDLIKNVGTSTSNVIKSHSDEIRKETSIQLSFLEKAHANAQNSLSKSLSNILDSVIKTTYDISELEKTIGKFYVDQSIALDESCQKQLANIERASTRLEKEGLEITKRVADNIQNMAEDNNKILKAAVTNIDNAMDKKINDSLNSLGQQLVSISNKFVYDYSKLAEKLKDLSLAINKIG